MSARAADAVLRLAGLSVAALAMTGLGACATDDAGTQPSISIPFDPYEFDANDLLKQAEAHCEAYGLKAVYLDETIDPHSVRWRYRHYLCVE